MFKLTLKFLSDIKVIFISIFINWPSGQLGTFFRNFIYSNKLKKNGQNVLIHKGVIITFPELVVIGDECIIGENVKLMPGDSHGIYIGKNTAIAENVYIRAANHNFDDLDIPIKQQSHNCASFCYESSNYSIIIEEDVWVGANAIILSGSFIGRGSIIAAGAVISNKIPPFSIVVGNPGRVVSNRKNKL
jgi:acetyltransferase-like isoleucine patch superfamily enzyme